ncbi:MAG: VacJ family lipoprotein [Methylophilaceae bacterium]|nr:VacJ family lipoprotein [Methylophilaceae bacterium]
MRNKSTGVIVSVFLTTLLGGCASQANKDPLESLNRGVYKFNDTADKAVIKPIAGTYKALMPSPIRSGINNFFSNINTVVSVANNLLQFKFSNAMTESGRFIINSTFGIGGLFDLAGKDGIEKHNEDFGQTLGYWGVGDGAYLVLPLLGASSLRDTTGLIVDSWAFDPLYYIHNVPTRTGTRFAKAIDTRAQYLPASDLLDEAALDPYAYMRDAYFQRRTSQINDGEAPALKIEDDEFSVEKPVTSAVK